MLLRQRALQTLDELLGVFPVVGIVGARQVGKTTLALAYAERAGVPVTHLDLENPRHLARLDAPLAALESLTGLVVIDEIQRRPDLFPILRVLADRPMQPARFIILGSASGELLRQGSESLAGRIAWFGLGGLDLDEVGADALEALWLRGGYPRSFLAQSERASVLWRRALIQTYVERDLPNLGLRLAPTDMRRFWKMLAHYSGQTWNGSDIGRSLGITEKTARRYLDILVETFMARVLAPVHSNAAKRLVKAPRAYVADTGLLHTLLDLDDREALLNHPRLGASWEGFMVTRIVSALGVPWERCGYWALHSGAEIDLVIEHDGRRRGFEIKRTDRPGMTPSIRSALEALELERVDVVYPGDACFPLADRVFALGATSLHKELRAQASGRPYPV